MKAYYKNKLWSNAQRKVMAEVCERQIANELEDVSKRCQYLWAAAMLEIGLKPSTVRKVIAKLPEVTDFYAYYQTEQLGDYVMNQRLSEKGIDIGLTKEEM